MEPSCPLGTSRCIPQAKFHQKPYNKSFIDQVCSVKMAGYWPRSFFASLWTSTSSRSLNTQKKNLANIQPSWPHTWSITHKYWSADVTLDYRPLFGTLGPGVRFSKDPKTSRARKPSRKAPETTFGCFSKHPKNFEPEKYVIFPVNFTGTHYLPKSVFGSVFLVLA